VRSDEPDEEVSKDKGSMLEGGQDSMLEGRQDSMLEDDR
jgi:hypothetical protein